MVNLSCFVASEPQTHTFLPTRQCQPCSATYCTWVVTWWAVLTASQAEFYLIFGVCRSRLRPAQLGTLVPHGRAAIGYPFRQTDRPALTMPNVGAEMNICVGRRWAVGLVQVDQPHVGSVQIVSQFMSPDHVTCLLPPNTPRKFCAYIVHSKTESLRVAPCSNHVRLPSSLGQAASDPDGCREPLD